MAKVEIIKLLKSKNPELNNSQLESIIQVFTKTIINGLENGHKIELRSFGSIFTKKIQEKKSARNPKTGELIYVPPKNKVRFKISKKLKKFINQK